ncbi:MAG: anti-sigma F factor [Lachnospiraceae bacterium]|nr:anti-sigma F factor [Lachnospiraceae bacterium]MEE1341476.1 anti-sigma F factor [Lachnospiraceae bacterium]
MYTNEMKIEFDSKSENEGFARTTVAVFLTQLDPTLEELADIKTVVSEAVTNSIIHGYENKEGKVVVEVRIEDRDITIKITDYGVGIEDISKAREPLYTSKPELERSGMGFAFMEAFMDELDVQSSVGAGTVVTMKKHMEQRK